MERRLCMSRCFVLFSVVSVFVFLLYVMDIYRTWENNLPHNSGTNLQFQKEHHPIIIPPAPTEHHTNPSLCTFQPVSPEEAAEEKLLLHSIAWPETPPFSSLPPLKDTSDPANSTFTILPKRGGGGGQWHVGDQLEVLINICDFQGRPKKYGGDVLLARLHNPDVDAGVAGRVMDHLNGSYTAVFPLLWEGSAQVQVTLVHPSEAVSVLRWLNTDKPDRISYKSQFKSGSVSEITICHMCLPPTKQPLCDFTDPRTGEPWFCYKPKKLSCDARISHSFGGFKQTIRPDDSKLFQQGINMKIFIPASGPAEVTVLPKREDEPEVKAVMSGVAGYYYQGVWRSLGDTPVQQFNSPSAISQCLRNKLVYLYGDSTIRQWFEHFVKVLPDLREFPLPNPKQSGPRLGLDDKNRIMVTYRSHGPPIRFSNIISSELRYVANELDGVPGGGNTVIVVGIWSHFSNLPIEIYTRRLMGIRRAMVRLLTRAPDTVIIIRTANPKHLTLYESLTNSDWYTIQRYKVLRAIFKGLNVHLVDAWDINLAHKLPHSLHPQPPIIKIMIDVVLSYICKPKTVTGYPAPVSSVVMSLEQHHEFGVEQRHRLVS